jgi:UDP-N-acetyl-2-amino-2-deoxyglucuronate dehydrogenase
MKLKYAVIGVGGYIAPRHLKAISETGGEVVAAIDKSDSVGVLDQYFPEAAFFTEFERFDRHLEKMRLAGNPVHYVVVCTPNYLHDPYIRFGLKYGADVICEKPLVLNPENAQLLMKLEQETGKKVYTILQLRLNSDLLALKQSLKHETAQQEVVLTYITARGQWYYTSWKGDEAKSGGVMTNIGIHLFDLLIWLFGPVQEIALHQSSHDRASGVVQFGKAKVRWFLSISAETMPQTAISAGRRAWRAFAVGDKEIDISQGFDGLHTESYRQILQNNGFGIAETLPSLQLVWQLRNRTLDVLPIDAHPFAFLPQSEHPFKKN